nr:nuclear transport factor 2 family protein [Pseudaestuariivita rosea]
MSLQDIANELVSGCREGRDVENIDKLYDANVVSVEAADFSGMGRETHGIQGLKGKHDWWNTNFEVKDFKVDGPFLHGDDRFSVIFEMDTVQKDTGERTQGKEVAVYHVANGKITREEFFYAS